MSYLMAACGLIRSRSAKKVCRQWRIFIPANYQRLRHWARHYCQTRYKNRKSTAWYALLPIYSVINFGGVMTESLLQWLQSEQIGHIIKASVLLLTGFICASMASRAVTRFFSKNFSQHHIVLFKRLLYWLIVALFVASALKQLGFSLSVLLGAAGVLSVALGFASQTSASNLISGLFLIG